MAVGIARVSFFKDVVPGRVSSLQWNAKSHAHEDNTDCTHALFKKRDRERTRRKGT